MKVAIRNVEFEVAAEPADFWGWVAEGRYDREWKVMDEYLRPEHTFLDLGAWVGSHSLYASTIAKRVVAVEPDPVAHDILFCNSLDEKIEPWRFAISDHHGTITLGSGFLGSSTTRKNPNAGGGIGAWEPGHQFEVRCNTLRNFVKAAKLEDPLFIKMDVEGSEEDILEDVEFFREHKPILHLETHPWWWKDGAATRERIEQISKYCMVIQQ